MKAAAPLLVLLLLIPPLEAQELGNSPGIVATVGDDPITQGQLDKRILRELNSGGRLPKQGLQEDKYRLSKMVLDVMIDELLILQEAARHAGGRKDPSGGNSGDSGKKANGGGAWARVKKTLVSDREVDLLIEQRIEELGKKNFKFTSTQHFYDYVERTMGLGREELREEIRRQRAIQKYLRSAVYRGMDVFVSPSESRYYYRTHLDEFSSPVNVSFRQIFLYPDRDYAPSATLVIEEELEKIRGIEDLARKEAAFVKLAKKFSQEHELPQHRGRLWEKSFEELKSWVHPIADKLKQLEKGEVSRRFLSARGWHYMLLIEREEGKPKSYAEAQKEIEQKIKAERQEMIYRQLIRRLRAKTALRIFLPGAPELTREGGEEAPAEEKETSQAGDGAAGGGDPAAARAAPGPEEK